MASLKNLYKLRNKYLHSILIIRIPKSEHFTDALMTAQILMLQEHVLTHQTFDPGALHTRLGITSDRTNKFEKRLMTLVKI